MGDKVGGTRLLAGREKQGLKTGKRGIQKSLVGRRDGAHGAGLGSQARREKV